MFVYIYIYIYMVVSTLFVTTACTETLNDTILGGFSVCPCGDPWGTPLRLETRHSWAPVKPPRRLYIYIYIYIYIYVYIYI